MNKPEGEDMNQKTAPVNSLANVAASRATAKSAQADERGSSSTQEVKRVGAGLQAQNVHAWFSNKHVLEDVSLNFDFGTVTALIGPSGCGKSTFIRILNRMHEFIPGAAMAGEVLLEGRDIYRSGVDVTKIRLG